MIPMKNKWRQADRLPALLTPPNFKEIGPVTFTGDDRKALAAWLNEEGWPKERMNIAMLEGYLVAMIVWPVELSPGAWLPAIWGIRGWKVAEKISAPELFHKFNRLVIGYRQHLALVLNTTPHAYLPGLQGAVAGPIPADGALQWSLGFLSALQHGSQGFNWRSPEVTDAIEVIAEHAQPATPPSVKTQERIAAELAAAVLAIVSDRAVSGATSTKKAVHHAPLH
jgi:yecA family protein